MIGPVPIPVAIGLVAFAGYVVWGIFLAFQRQEESPATKRSHYESGVGYYGGGGSALPPHR